MTCLPGLLQTEETAREKGEAAVGTQRECPRTDTPQQRRKKRKESQRTEHEQEEEEDDEEF